MQTVRRDWTVSSYSVEHPPRIRVAPGERFRVEARNGFGDNVLVAGATLEGLEESLADPLAGPVWVEDSEPGDALAVHIESIEPTGEATQGTLPGIGVLEWPCTPLELFQPDAGVLDWHGLRIPLEPMIGCIGVWPRADAIASVLPGDHGGNMDTKHVAQGSTVLLPVFHEGAGLVLGDTKTMIGDGEVGGCSPQCDADVTVRVELLKAAGISRPRISGAGRLMFLASAPTMEEAARLCVRDAVEAITAETRLSADHAYLLLTMRGDLEVSQAVNALVTLRMGIDEALWQALPR